MSQLMNMLIVQQVAAVLAVSVSELLMKLVVYWQEPPVILILAYHGCKTSLHWLQLCLVPPPASYA